MDRLVDRLLGGEDEALLDAVALGLRPFGGAQDEIDKIAWQRLGRLDINAKAGQAPAPRDGRDREGVVMRERAQNPLGP